MTRAASQVGDADSSRTPGLNSSVQTSMNDNGVRYYLCLNESASVISYELWSRAKRGWISMKHEDDTSNMSCNLKYSAWIAKRIE